MTAIDAGSRPRLRRGVRLVFDATRGMRVLLYPEGVLVPNETAAEVLARCDGVATVGSITAELAAQYDGVQAGEVIALLDRLTERRFVEVADEPALAGGRADEPALAGGRAAQAIGGRDRDAASLEGAGSGAIEPADSAPVEGAPAVEGDPR